MVISEPLSESQILDIEVLKQYYDTNNEIKFASALKNISDKISYNGKKRIIFTVPESAGDIFLATSLLRSLKEIHSPCDIYFCCEEKFFLILDSNPYIHKLIEYDWRLMDDQNLMEGFGDWLGLFDVSIFAPVSTQKFSNWIRNGEKSKIAFNLFYDQHAPN